MGYNRNMPPDTVYEYAALLLRNLPRGKFSRKADWAGTYLFKQSTFRGFRFY